MANWFEISPYFSFRWVDNNVSSPYNTLPLESHVDDLNYAQPVQCGGGGYQSDTGQIQLTSDFTPTGGLYTWYNEYVKAVTFTAIDPPIIGNMPGTNTPITFVCYNAEIDFSDVDPGLYYAKINYTDGSEVVHDWRTSPLDVQIHHEGTQRIEATNFTNDKGVVFVNADLSTLTIVYRVGSLIRSPLVKTDATDYEDQYNDRTQEVSVPFITLTQLFYAASGYLLPFYVIEKINLLYSLNLVLIDGNPFAKLSNSDFKPTRAETGSQGAWWEVEIQPNFSYPNEQFITGTPTDSGDYIVIKQAKTFKAQSADFAFAGNFTAGKNLIRLAVKNIGMNAFTLKVGNAEGDNSYGQFDIPAQLDNSLDIGKLFTSPVDVWISGIAGCNLDITFDWNDYLAKNTIPGPSAQIFAKNTLYYFQEVTPGSFVVEFNVATGLGNVGTDHVGCVLAGTNGTPTVTELLIRGWKSDEVLPANTRNTVVGVANNEVTLIENQLPQHSHLIANGDSNNTILTPGINNVLVVEHNQTTQRDYELKGTTTAPDRGNTSHVGIGASIDVTNRALILPAFYYIGV